MKLLALIYREKTGCKQYPFDSIEELKLFTERKPYCNESLGVIVFFNQREAGRTKLPAGKVVEYVERTFSDVKKLEETYIYLATMVLHQAEDRDQECAFWFISALSKLCGLNRYMNVQEVLQLAMTAMPAAAAEWNSYVAKTKGYETISLDEFYERGAVKEPS